MKKLFFLLVLMGALFANAQNMNIVSYNIRLNTPSDGINAWPNRVEMVTGLLQFHEADIFGLQEAMYGQITDIAGKMPEFSWIGVGRDDGKTAGEFCPVFYNNQKFKLLESGSFWLSETPEKPGLGWDAACNRVCTWAKFKTKKGGKTFLVMNTHFDHMGKVAREKSAELILQKIKEIVKKQEMPVFLTGDFNLTPESKPIELIKQSLNDSREVSLMPPYGPTGTFNAFDHNHPLDDRIDYIFVNGKPRVLKYGVLTDARENRYPSDHLPVFIEVAL